MGPYLDVLRRPGVGRPVAGTVLASAPIGILGLAVLLLVRRSGGTFAAAGLASGMLALGTATGTVVQGRLIDRYGQPRVLLIAAAAQTAALVALVVVATTAPAAVPLCGFAAGAGEPQVTASLRALWVRLVPPRLYPAAMTLSSLLFETPVLAGPLLLTLVLGVASPAVAILLAAALFLTGTTVLATSPVARAWRGAPRSAARAGYDPALRTVLLVTAGHGVIVGAVQVCAAALAASSAGLLYAALSAGSLAGAAVLGPRVQAGRPVWWLSGLTALVAVTLAVGAAAGGPAGLGAALLVVGGCLGPAGVLGYALAGRHAPDGRTVEVFTLVTASALGALAAGSAVAGTLVDRFGPGRTVVLVAAGTLLLAGLIAVRARSPVRGLRDEHR